TGLSRPLRVLSSEVAQVAGVAAELEQALGTLEVEAGRLGLAVENQDLGAEQVCAREMEGVLRRLEQRDRAAQVPQPGLRVALHRREPRGRRVEADPRRGLE